MARAVIGRDNKLLSAVLTTNSAIATLPVTNLVIPHRVVQWATASLTGQFFDADFGSAMPIGAVTLHGVTAAPLQSPGAPPTGNWRVKLGSSQGGTQVHDSGAMAMNIARHFWQTIYVLPADLSARWLRVEIPDGLLYIGLAYAGPLFRPQRNFSYGRAHGPVDPSVRSVSKGGNLYTDLRPKFRVQEFELKGLTEAEVHSDTLPMDFDLGLAGNALFVPDYESAYKNQDAIFGPVNDASPAVHAVLPAFAKRYRINERL